MNDNRGTHNETRNNDAGAAPMDHDHEALMTRIFDSCNQHKKIWHDHITDVDGEESPFHTISTDIIFDGTESLPRLLGLVLLFYSTKQDIFSFDDIPVSQQDMERVGRILVYKSPASVNWDDAYGDYLEQQVESMTKDGVPCQKPMSEDVKMSLEDYEHRRRAAEKIYHDALYEALKFIPYLWL